jgi:hypothetical protein
VRLPGTAPSGGGAIAKSEDGMRCVVAGKECACPLMVLYAQH